MSGYPCPYCEERSLETVATVPYVRGFVVAYQVGSKKMIGCTSCVRKQIYKEAGLSSLIGWFSVTAVFLNPLFISYGLVRGIFVGKNPQAVRQQLALAGLPPEPALVHVLQVAYGLAAAMITADNKVEQQEVHVAAQWGQHLFAGFDANMLWHAVQNHKNLPAPAELSSFLAHTLDEPGKQALYNYLQAIASADGHIAPEEQATLNQVAAGLWPHAQPAALAA
jgi:uncharacterized tellurite resistance protein B-like protein